MIQEELIELLQKAVSPFQCVDFELDHLRQEGFTELSYEDNWTLKPGHDYVINHHDTTLFAFSIGKDFQPGDMLRMAAAHTDYPYLRIKPKTDFLTSDYAQLNVEVYGGPILNTWFDRPLGVAGRVALRSDDMFHPKMVNYSSNRPIVYLPNLAIHQNREVNKGVEINNQTDLMLLADVVTDKEASADYFLNFLVEELGVEKADILDFELNTYSMEQPSYVGVRETLLSSPRLDNQTSVAALVHALLAGKRTHGINLIALFDHEEIGSSTKQGAASILLHDMIHRILSGLGCSTEEIERTLYSAMLLSVDVAHAMHPNHQNKMDPINRPTLGKGFCIKEACSQSYATDAEAVSILRQICDANEIPYQIFVNRSDVRGGGTLGSIASTLTPVKTVDIGVPLLAMHSSTELMGRSDIEALTQAVETYFSI